MTPADELRDWIASHDFAHRVVVNDDGTVECSCGAQCAAAQQLQTLFRLGHQKR